MGSGITAVNIGMSLFSIFLLLTSILMPTLVEADTCFLWVFCTKDAEAQAVVPNSQNGLALQAINSPDQTSSTTNDDITIVGGTSILPDTQSLGDIKTIDDDQISLYVVHPGDTLPAIAQMFGISVNTIIWANNIKDNKVSVGDKLVILPVSGVQYTVKKGDTLQKIATTYKGDLDTISQFNNLSPDAKLSIGDVIIIPDGQVSASESGPVLRSGSSGSSGSVKVGPGGTSPWASGAMAPPSGAPTVGSRGSDSPTVIGYYERPILGGVKTQGIHGHNAVDLSSSTGTPIMASADGEVIIARSGGWNGGYGSYIEIQHPNGTQTLYAHLSKVSVSVGDSVTQGQVIGKLGSTGDSTGPHVHFEIHGAQNPF